MSVPVPKPVVGLEVLLVPLREPDGGLCGGPLWFLSDGAFERRSHGLRPLTES